MINCDDVAYQVNHLEETKDLDEKKLRQLGVWCLRRPGIKKVIDGHPYLEGLLDEIDAFVNDELDEDPQELAEEVTNWYQQRWMNIKKGIKDDEERSEAWSNDLPVRAAARAIADCFSYRPEQAWMHASWVLPPSERKDERKEMAKEFKKIWKTSTRTNCSCYPIK